MGRAYLPPDSHDVRLGIESIQLLDGSYEWMSGNQSKHDPLFCHQCREGAAMGGVQGLYGGGGGGGGDRSKKIIGFLG